MRQVVCSSKKQLVKVAAAAAAAAVNARGCQPDWANIKLPENQTTFLDERRTVEERL